MAKSGATIKVKLRSESGYYKTTTKNKKTCPEKLELRKYDPILRKHVIFKETKV